MAKEKVYITRDEDDSWIWVWRKPLKGNFAPYKKKDCDMICWHREDLDNADAYIVEEFKDKFGLSIRMKTKKCVHLEDHLLNSDKYKLFTDMKKV